MKIISRILCSLALFSFACDDGNGLVDRTELSESLPEQGWYVDDGGELVRELEDGTVEHARSGIDRLTAPTDPVAVSYGVWTKSVGTESCLDLFGQFCSASVPNQQCAAGSVCEWYPGASCFEVISYNKVQRLRCKR